MAQSPTTESGGAPASNGSDPTSTGFQFTGPAAEGSTSKKHDAETYATGIPAVLDEDSDSDRITSGYLHTGPNASTKPGSPAGVPGEITNLGYNPATASAPSLTRHGRSRQHGYEQGKNKG